MRSIRSLGHLGVLLAVVLPSAGLAEGFVDAYFGGAFTQDERISGDVTGNFRSEFDDSLVGGLRGGYWFRRAPWLGIAGDISSFAPDEDRPSRGDITVTPISTLLMLRVPIGATDELPGGRVQPYAAVGPGIFVSTLHVNIPGNDYDGLSGDIGLDTRAGLRVQLFPWLAVFGEYRYTRFDPTWHDDVGSLDVEFRSTFETHHVNFGVGFHFGGPDSKKKRKERVPEPSESL